MSRNHSVPRRLAAALPRLCQVIGPQGSGLWRAIDILHEIASGGALAGLAPLILGLTHGLRQAGRSWSRASSGRGGRARIPFVLMAAGGVALLALQACAPVLLKNPSPPGAAAADPPEDIRMMRADRRFEEVSIEGVARRVHAARADQPFSILALSEAGPGAFGSGAFGAGSLAGLTRAGKRPQFSVVTGVSAGALLAVYAFAGPDWDPELIDANTNGRAEQLLRPRGFGAVFDSRGFRGKPLERLIDHSLSDELLRAVAREAASGRLLLVATTNVDSGETEIWDLGSIAMNGGTGARTLFRDVLVAAASAPGMFPPVIIRIQDDWGDYSEAHVGGGATVPILVPSPFLRLATGISAAPAGPS